jgi:mono/diheme cytochrome c family protein
MRIGSLLLPREQGRCRSLILAGLLLIGSAGEVTGTAAPKSEAKGKSIYAQLCMKCHGRDGRGDGYKNLTPPPADLTSPAVQNKLDASLYRTIHEGRKDSAMGVWKYTLTDEEISEVLAYVRQLGSASKAP